MNKDLPLHNLILALCTNMGMVCGKVMKKLLSTTRKLLNKEIQPPNLIWQLCTPKENVFLRII